MSELARMLEQYSDTPYPETGTEQPRGDARLPAFARAYEPSWRDRLATMVTGEDRDPFRRLLAQRLLGSSGLGPSTDPNQPWRAAPVAAPLLDAIEAAYNDRHGPFAVHALDAGLEAMGAGAPRAMMRELWAKPPALPYDASFVVPIMQGRDKVGRVTGYVDGPTAHVENAYRTAIPSGARAPNSVGYGEMRRVFNSIRDQFPQVSRVTADRVTGARAKASKFSFDPAETWKQRQFMEGSPLDYALGGLDRVSKGRLANSPLGYRINEYADKVREGGWGGYNLDIAVMPEWQRILNEAGRRGIR